MAQENTFRGNGEELAEALVQISSEDIFLVNPSAPMVRGLLEHSNGEFEGETIRVLANKSVYMKVFDDVIPAGTAVEGIQDGKLEFRILEADYAPTAAFDSESVYSFVTQGGTGIAVEVERGSELESIKNDLETQWESTSAPSIRTPPLTELYESMEKEFGERLRERFETGLEMQYELNAAEFDKIDILLLASAAEELLTYDIGWWAEGSGLCSKGSISRRKQDLEEDGLIHTTKVKQEIGRPKQRLHLAPEYDDLDFESLLEEFVSSQ
jgi:hypothetical protein